MAMEIDFLHVGDGERSGDAIALRFGPDGGPYQVMVVDGGTKDSGERLVEHIGTHYNTKRVDYVVNTHPDGDHSSGLSVVVEKMDVGCLCMHRPWEYAEDIRHLFSDGRITDESLERTIREALESAHNLEQLALTKRVQIVEPYQGSTIGPFVVLGPEKQWYLGDLLPNFRDTPKPKKAAVDTLAEALGLGGVAEMVKGAASWVAETMGKETLGSDGVTSAENESSVILLGAFSGKKIMLTGDAGIGALARAHAYAATRGWSLDDLWLSQIPHHGSRNNVSPAILDRIKSTLAIASAAKDDPLHPRRVATNAYRRRGARVWATKGKTIHFNIGLPRNGWVASEEVPFFDQVEA